jgi:hypothetical protein
VISPHSLLKMASAAVDERRAITATKVAVSKSTSPPISLASSAAVTFGTLGKRKWVGRDQLQGPAESRSRKADFRPL